MQKIRFVTSAGTVEIGDDNTLSLAGERIFKLTDFDGNSAKTELETVTCIGMPGQRVRSVTSAVKIVSAKIAFAPVYFANNRFSCAGSAGMYALRREVLRRFPLGVKGTLTYTNDYGSYEIGARVDQAPTVTTKDGYLCECTILFTCDYPYWSRSVMSEVKTVSGGGTYTFVPQEYGDVESPISGIITGSMSGGDAIKFSIVNQEDRFRRIDFCRCLTEGLTLKFNSGFNNEWKVTVNDSTDNSYVYYVDYSEPCSSIPNVSRFVFTLSCSGSAEVQLIYHNLYIAV